MVSRDLRLDYLREYQLGRRSTTTQRRNVPLRVGHISNLHKRAHLFDYDTFAWKLARRLEGREHVVDSEGIWPINCWRCERRFGLPGRDIFPRDAPLEKATREIYNAAREMRRLCYFRAANAEEAKSLIAAGQVVRYATQITSDWYDPPGGTIVVANENPVIVGSHAVPLDSISSLGDGHFFFRNSWGPEWGYEGSGAISFEHFDRFILEAWIGGPLGLFIPFAAATGPICLEWKWSLNDAIGIHGREIVDAKTTDRLAWAFCRRRGGFLDVEEFYVWPTERKKGYGRSLADMVKNLARSMQLPIRLLVSYADTEPDSRENLDAAARLLGVRLSESGTRWVHQIGTLAPPSAHRSACRPQRPAFLLERLRPKDEKPFESPIEYSVFWGTNRCPVEMTNFDAGFSANRDSALHTGVSKVRIPKTHRFGSKGNAWLGVWNWLTEQHPRILENRAFANEVALAAELSLLQSAFGEESHNLLYVHGFNVTFNDAVVQAAHFGVDLKVRGATFVFSWPSAGRIGAYLADEASIEACLPFFGDFVQRILRNTGTAPLSIIVHSMGNRAVLRFLEFASRELSEATKGRVRNLIFAAPDVDTQVFTSTAKEILHLPARTTLYATRADLALLASGWLHEFSRAGLAPPVVTVPGMDTVLVEGFDVLTLGHNYHAEAASVLHDMFILLHYNAPAPPVRPALHRAETVEGALYWKLPV